MGEMRISGGGVTCGRAAATTFPLRERQSHLGALFSLSPQTGRGERPPFQMQLLCVCGEGEGHCNGVTPPLRKELSHPPAVITPPETIMLTPAHIQPLAALIGGILILL